MCIFWLSSSHVRPGWIRSGEICITRSNLAIWAQVWRNEFANYVSRMQQGFPFPNTWDVSSKYWIEHMATKSFQNSWFSKHNFLVLYPKKKILYGTWKAWTGYRKFKFLFWDFSHLWLIVQIHITVTKAKNNPTK